MRKYCLFAIMALVVACATETELSNNEIFYPAEVSASIDDEAFSPETKVYADANLKVLWDNDDRISLFNKYTYNKEYRFAGSTGANSGTFKEVSTGDVVVGNELDYVYAVYPYQEMTEISNSGVITLNLPAEQSYKENSFGRGANTMVSATTNTELLFKNLCGYLILKLYGDDVSVSSISIKGNNHEVLAGAADVTAAVGSVPSLSFRSTGTSEELTLTCETPVTLGATSADATVFWLVIPPIPFTNGFTLTVTDPDGNTFEKSASLNFEIQRNKTFRMGALEVVLETPQPKNVIYYTSSNGETVAPNNTAAFGVNIISNTYENGQGTITFDGNVTSIGQTAFFNRKSLTSISIPASVTSIGQHAFYNCSGLTAIDIPDGVTSIGQYAFYGCKNLASISIPMGVATIEVGTFYDCSSLPSVIIPAGVTSIGNQAFRGCSSLTSISIPAGVTTIEANTFYDCSSLPSVIIPAGVTSIGDQAFRGCSSLTSISVPDGVTSIGREAFYGCKNLASISIPMGVTTIEAGTFFGCNSLISVSIPDGVTSIGQSAFGSCIGLTSISIPNGVTSIGATAFWVCDNLTSISIPGSVTSIGMMAFSDCPNLTSIVVNANIPPIGGTAMFSGSCPIYVPSGSVEAYKAAEYWSDYADRIRGFDNPDWIIGSFPFPGYVIMAMQKVNVQAGQTVNANMSLWDGGEGYVSWMTGQSPQYVNGVDEGTISDEIRHTYTEDYSGYIYALSCSGRYSYADGMTLTIISIE